MNEDLSKEILNDIEAEKIANFAEDTVAFQAVKKYVLAVALKQGIPAKGEEYKGNMNWALQMSWGATEPQGIPRSDEELGQNLRALTFAVKLVESGFQELKEIAETKKVGKKEQTKEEEKTNPAE